MYKRNVWLLAFCVLLVFAFTGCSHETDKGWFPITFDGTFIFTGKTVGIVLQSSGFVFFGVGSRHWPNYWKGWAEVNYSYTKIRFNYTDIWVNGAWQPYSYSDVYDYSQTSNPKEGITFTLSGNGLMSGIYVYTRYNMPGELASDATYRETVDKLDEIIAYCNDNPRPGNINDPLKLAAESEKATIKPLESTWDDVSAVHISTINTAIIAQLYLQ